MPEIAFTIDTETGTLEMKVTGVAGPSCADVAKLATELLGMPVRNDNTPEFYTRPRTVERVRPQQPQ